MEVVRWILLWASDLRALTGVSTIYSVCARRSRLGGDTHGHVKFIGKSVYPCVFEKLVARIVDGWYAGVYLERTIATLADAFREVFTFVKVFEE